MTVDVRKVFLSFKVVRDCVFRLILYIYTYVPNSTAVHNEFTCTFVVLPPYSSNTSVTRIAPATFTHSLRLLSSRRGWISCNLVEGAEEEQRYDNFRLLSLTFFTSVIDAALN